MRIYLTLGIVMLVLLLGCYDLGDNSPNNNEIKTLEESVTIKDMGTHFRVEMDYTAGFSPRELGEEYGKKVLAIAPNFEEIVDEYLISQYGRDIDTLHKAIADLSLILSNVPRESRESIVGAASQMVTQKDSLGDKKLSFNEYLLFNLHLDLGHGHYCAALTVSGEKTDSNHPYMIRCTDWKIGRVRELHSVMVMKKRKGVVTNIAALGYQGFMTAVNDKGLMVSGFLVMYASSNELSSKTYPWSFTILEALEENDNIDNFASTVFAPLDNGFEALADAQIMVADKKSAVVIETQISNGTRFREMGAELVDNAYWELPFALPAINTLLLKGNSNTIELAINSARLKSMREEVLEACKDSSESGEKITKNEMKNIFSYISPESKGKPGNMANGDIYNGITQHIVLFDPVTLEMEAYFIGKDGVHSVPPVFEQISINSSF